MRQQVGWDEHARFMDGLVDDGFVLMAGPLEGDRETLWIVDAESEDVIRARMAEDPWASKGMLSRPASRAGPWSSTAAASLAVSPSLTVRRASFPVASGPLPSSSS